MSFIARILHSKMIPFRVAAFTLATASCLHSDLALYGFHGMVWLSPRVHIDGGIGGRQAVPLDFFM